MYTLIGIYKEYIIIIQCFSFHFHRRRLSIGSWLHFSGHEVYRWKVKGFCWVFKIVKNFYHHFFILYYKLFYYELHFLDVLELDPFLILSLFFWKQCLGKNEFYSDKVKCIVGQIYHFGQNLKRVYCFTYKLYLHEITVLIKRFLVTI